MCYSILEFIEIIMDSESCSVTDVQFTRKLHHKVFHTDTLIFLEQVLQIEKSKG